jgi:uncharacterized YigZ family protein
MSPGYKIPAETHSSEIVVVNSRFITNIAKATSVDETKQFLADIRAQMPDASHHVYAFRVGYGNSVIEGRSDDGEPSGTAGPPILAVLRGTEIGDVIVIVTRYFGGTKLGTGGLVRAYSEAARIGLNALKTEFKIEKKILGIECAYSHYDSIKRLISQHKGVVDDEVFSADITILATFAVEDIPQFTTNLTELTAGCVQPVFLSD